MLAPVMFTRPTKKPTSKPTPKQRTPKATRALEVLSFAEVGRRAARDAQRAHLLDSLVRNGWNLSAVARELDMSNASNVRRAIETLELLEHFEKAKADGLVKPGRPSESTQE